MGSKRTGKANGPTAPWKERAQAIRHASAEERNKAYRAITPQQIIANLDKLGLRALRERARLNARIEQAAQPKSEPKKQPQKGEKNGHRTGK